MDEPLSNLDAQFVSRCAGKFARLQQRLGITMLYVTHDQLEAMTMADQVVLMRQGRHRAGRTRPRSSTSAGDHLRGALHRNAAHERAAGDRIAPLSESWQGTHRGKSAPDTLAIGVRAEAARLERGSQATCRYHRISGCAIPWSRHGSVTRPFIVRLPGTPGDAAGEQVSIAWDTGAAHWFDATSGEGSTRTNEPSDKAARTKGGSDMKRRQFLTGVAATAGATIAKPAIAQGATEFSFYYPVAVGGPITKLVDTFAADFEKENPSIKVKPIYAGTYQETIVKALTAHKSGNPPTTSVLLSTDMFTLIDEDAIVPIDDFVKTDDDKTWLKSFFPAFMLNSQTGGKTWGAPFQRSTVVLYWNKDLFKEAGLDPDKPPADWTEQVAFSQKLTKRTARAAPRNGASRCRPRDSHTGCSRASRRKPVASS